MTTPLTSVIVVCRTRPPISAVPAIAWAIDSFLDISWSWTIETATANNFSVRLLRRIAANEGQHTEKSTSLKNSVANAIKNNDLSTFAWLVIEYYPSGSMENPLYGEGKRGRTPYQQRLHATNQFRDFLRRYSSCSGAPIDALQRTCNTTFKFLPESVRVAVDSAFDRGDLAKIRWMHDIGLEFQDEDVQHGVMVAIQQGYVRVLVWAVARLGLKLNQDHMDEAVVSGRLDVAKWLFKTGVSTSINADVIVKAATARLWFASVKWTLQSLVVHHPDRLGPVVNVAARFDRLDILELLSKHYNGAWTGNAMDMAARNGNLEVVKWIHTNRKEGCTTAAMDGATRNGHLETVEWLHSHRSEGCTTAAMDEAAKRNHLDVVQWLHSHRSEGCTTAAMNNAAAFGHLEMLKWLHSNRTEGCTTQAMTRAAAKGHLDVVQWLFANRRESYSAYAELTASLHGHDHIVEWLRTRSREGLML